MASDADTQKNKQELLDIVDDNDVVIGVMPRSQAYAENQRKRIVYVFAIHPLNHDIVLAVRGKDVSWRPLHYSATVGGHVETGETADVAASREMAEEVGLQRDVHLVAKYATEDPTNGYKSFDYIYVTFAAVDELTIDPVEVDRLDVMTLQQAMLFAARDEALLHPKLQEQLDLLHNDWARILALRS